MRVLLADPSPANRARLREILRSIDAEPVELDAPQDAIARIERCEVDAVVTDLVSPGAARFALWRAMRLACADSGARFIVYVGMRPPWIRDEQLRATADAVLTLPIGAAQLVDALIGAAPENDTARPAGQAAS